MAEYPQALTRAVMIDSDQVTDALICAAFTVSRWVGNPAIQEDLSGTKPNWITICWASGAKIQSR
jgi:hypothetical protein